MRFSREAHVPVLSDKIQSILSGFSNSRTAPSFLVNRSKIILLASQAVSNREIAERLSVHYNTVSLWRRRFIEYTSLLSFIEAELPEDLKELVETILTDKYRSGAPWIYGDDVRAKIKLIACQDPKDYGYTLSHWNLPYLRIVLIETGVVENISVGALYHIPESVKLIFSKARKSP